MNVSTCAIETDRTPQTSTHQAIHMKHKADAETPKALSPKANMIWNAAGSITNLASQWLVTILIVRLSNGFNAAGIYSLASSICTMFAPLGQYRMKVYQVSDVEGENTLGEYLSFRMITSAAAFVLCMGYAIVTCKPNEVIVISLYALYYVVTMLIEVLHSCDQQHYRMDYIGQSLALQGIGTLIGFIIVFVTTQSLELSIICMATICAVIGIFLDLPRAKRFERIKLGITLAKTKHLLLRCLPIVISGVAVNAAPSIPRQVLASLSGTEALGIYASIAAPIAIIQMGATYVYSPLLSYFSDSYHKGDIKAFVKLLLKALVGIAGVGIVATAGIALFAKPLVGLLYGKKTVEYAYLMIPMVPFAMVTGLMWFANDLLTAVRDFRGTFAGGITSFVVATLAMTPLISTFGMNGVTYTGIVSCLISLAVMSVFLILKLKARMHAA